MTTTTEMKSKYDRMMDFAEHLCFKGYPELTEARKRKLWEEAKSFLEYCIENGATGYEDNASDPSWLPCDSFGDFFDSYDMTNAEYERYDRGKSKKHSNRFYWMLSAICRAALDILDGAGGVIGFTVGDIRRMYDGDIPEWFYALYEEPEKLAKAEDGALIIL